LLAPESFNPDPRQAAIDAAVECLKRHFTNAAGGPIKTPFYLSQLEAFYENEFFPWVISDATRQLVSEGFLRKFEADSVPGMETLDNLTRISFFVNSEALDGVSDDNIKVRMGNIAKLVNRYSSPTNSEMLGKHLEALVRAELRAQGFSIAGVHTNEYNGKKWSQTDHNLDIIAVHPNGKLVVGVEAKNTLDLIDTDEIDIKIDVCSFLGIVPVFAVRWIKPYIECIRLQHGFSWVFKTQMYPLGQEDVVKEYYDKLSALDRTSTAGRPLQWPISIRSDLPEKSVQKFQDWVTKVANNPPLVDTTERCTPKRTKQDEREEEREFDFEDYF
jgi:hypothetical protein